MFASYAPAMLSEVHIVDHPRSGVVYHIISVVSVCLSICLSLSVCLTITFESLDFSGGSGVYIFLGGSNGVAIIAAGGMDLY